MARKPMPQSTINQVKQLMLQGFSYIKIGEIIGKSPNAVKWMCHRNNIFKRKVVANVENEFCFLSEKELTKNIKALVAEYGIDNSPVCRKANETEIKQFKIRGSVLAI